jgi:hypothetical protein
MAGLDILRNTSAFFVQSSLPLFSTTDRSSLSSYTSFQLLIKSNSAYSSFLLSIVYIYYLHGSTIVFILGSVIQIGSAKDGRNDVKGHLSAAPA